MKRLRELVASLAWVSILSVSNPAQAQNTADARLELTFTLTDVTITDTLTSNTRSAIFETTSEVGDLRFDDIGPNGGTFTGESPNNPSGSVGSATASEAILLNGLDPFVDNYDQDSFGTGDSLVSTMITTASAQTPGSVFFGQVDSFNTLYFSTFGSETDQYTFHFDYSAVLTGSLDSTVLPGVTLAVARGNEVTGFADSTVSGTPNDFVVATDYFDMLWFNTNNSLMPIDDSRFGSFEVAFAPGDNNLEITFDTQLLVNAGVDAVPEPSSVGLFVFIALPSMVLRRRR